MKRNTLIRLAVTLLLAHGAAWAQLSPTELLAYVPADAEVVVGLDVQTLTANPAFDRLHHQLNTQTFDAGVATIEQVTGINLLRDIERVVLLGELRNQGQGALILKGHWYEEDLIALVAMNPSYEEQEHGAYSIHVWTDENTGKVNHAVFLQPDVLAMSEWPAVLRRIIDAASDRGRSLRSVQVPAQPDREGVGAFLLAFRPADPNHNARKNPVIGQLESLAVGLQAGETEMTLSLDGRAQDAHGATLLSEALRGLLAAAQLHVSGTRELPWPAQTRATGRQIESTVRVPMETVIAAATTLKQAKAAN